MDWIEEFFHVSPDGGSGVTEAIYYVVVGAGVTALIFRRRIGRWASGRRNREP